MNRTGNLEELGERVRGFLMPGEERTDADIIRLIERVVMSNVELRYATSTEKRELVTRLFHSMRGFDALQPLIDDPSITEIMVNRHDCIFIERDGRVELTDVKLVNEQKLLDVIHAIVGKVNRTVTESNPIVDARLPNGSRVHVVLSPVALDGPSLTIRKFPEQPLTMDDLLRKGALTDEAAEFLTDMVKAKYNLLIGGGTGSGKTTFLNVLAQSIPEEERVITIEDAAELQVRGLPNLVRLETKNANTEGKGDISIRQLIRASLRMRPNRIVVGEVRGAEALDMLQAMNTGHDGSLSTAHANSAADMLGRLETMVLSGAPLPVEVIRQQTASAIDLIIHLGRLRDRSRRVMEIQEVVGCSQGQIVLHPLFVFEEEGETPEGRVIGKLKHTENRLVNRFKLSMSGIQTDRW